MENKLSSAITELALKEEKRAAELVIAKKELVFQNTEIEKRATELMEADKELVFQIEERVKRSAELIIANKELAFQNDEKEKRAAELVIANHELAFQNDEKEKRAAELVIANKELAFQNDEKEKRAAELVIANHELAFQNDEKEKRATELGIANKELYQSQKLLQASLKEASDYKDALDETTIIAITDQKGIIKKVNSNFCKISKYTEEELIGQDHNILNSGYHSKAFIHDLWKTIANGKTWKGEFKNKAKDGTFYWVDTTIVPFLNKENKPYQYLAIRVDITQRKASEEELKSANIDLVFQNEEKGKRAAELGIANKKLAFENKEKEKRAAELGVANKELAFENEEKGKRAAELIVANKELVFQNEEKEKRAAELIIANKELESFTYISSHDLQEPLRKIQIFASRLISDESQNLSDKGKRHVTGMHDAASRMQALITDLLAYSQTTTLERKFESTDLTAIVASVLSDFTEAIAEKNAIVRVGDMCSALVIPFQFRQLMHNIIGNALKFSQAHLTPLIVIESTIIKGSKVENQKLLPDKDYCHITITDNGIGFEPRYKDHIFELFKRLHDKEKISGTGIGLTIVKKIVENHHGIITATGELNKGATFDIYIPAS